MARAYFLHQIKHKKDGTWDKGDRRKGQRRHAGAGTDPGAGAGNGGCQ